MEAPVIPIVMLGIGLYLSWFAVHYWGSDTAWPSTPVKDVLTGKSLTKPSGQVNATLVANYVESNAPSGTPGNPATATLTSVTVSSGGSATGQQIANTALKYSGSGYVYGGPADTPGNWDCSSFVSYVLSHDLHLGLPGGGSYGSPGYPPSSHGPTTAAYLLFGSPVAYGSEQPGDLVVSTVHMGIVIGNGQMISAQDPSLGTGVASYQSGFPGGRPYVRRVA